MCCRCWAAFEAIVQYSSSWKWNLLLVIPVRYRSMPDLSMANSKGKVQISTDKYVSRTPRDMTEVFASWVCILTFCLFGRRNTYVRANSSTWLVLTSHVLQKTGVAMIYIRRTERWKQKNTLPDVVTVCDASTKGFYSTNTTSAKMLEVVRWSSEVSSGMRCDRQRRQCRQVYNSVSKCLWHLQWRRAD